jgi:gliding motility-associated lipoprotein GldH
MKYSIQSLFITIAILITLFACDSNRVYEKNFSFDNKIWRMDSIATFEFNIGDKKAAYNVYINLRNSVSYPYRNVYITYNLQDSLGNILKKELVNYELFTRKTGEPLGESGIGDIYDHQFLILNSFEFSHKGKYKISFQHYMRSDTLSNIMAVGTRIEKALP